MRAFLLLCAVILGCLAAGSMLAYPAYLLVHPLNPQWAFHRIANRVSLLLLLVSLTWLLKHLRVNDRTGLGYTLDWRTFLRQSATALGLGVLMMLPVIGLLLALDIRVPNPEIAFTASTLGSLLLTGLIGGLVVALIEETLLRGAMHSAIERQSGRIAAVCLTAFVYAALHFIGKARVPHEEVQWLSGLVLIRGALSAFADPLALMDSFLALFAVGIVLGLVRIRTGGIAACIGLHAGWVWVIATARELTVRNPDASMAFLVGSYDGVIGWLVTVWTVLLLGAIAYATRASRGAPRGSAPPPA